MKAFLRAFVDVGPALAAVFCIAVNAASAQSELDRRGEAPANPYAAGDVWGQFHRNGYAQAATTARGPEAGDAFDVQYIAVPGRGGAPTQMHISEAYPDGSRTAWSTTLTHIVKARIKGEAFELADAYEITGRALDWNIHWNMQLARGNTAFVPSPNTREILRFGEAADESPMSKIIAEGAFALPEAVKGEPIVLNLSYDGWVIYVTDAAYIGAVRQDFSDHRFFDLGAATNDLSTHNSFPMDENGNIYIASFFAMTKVNWDGERFSLVWRAPYNFRGENCPPANEKRQKEVFKAITGKSCTGTGTTPTLVGRDGMDELVVVVDSHRENNLVAFWRNEPPADWTALPGQDRRVAGVLPLPHSTWAGLGFTAENSPPVSGYDIAVAQFAGLGVNPRCRRLRGGAPRGVQMARWDPDANRLDLLRANPDTPFNNEMTISSGSGLLYGSGRDRNCQYVYRGLDRATGDVAFEVPLGRSAKYVDGGNTNALLPDRSIVFGVRRGMVRLRPTRE
ncbi:MAG: hypothetical protein ACFB00_09445 [Parvularculaceae bacterium]